MTAPPETPFKLSACVLVYGDDGLSCVQYGEDSIGLATDEAPLSRYTTLPSAFAAAVRAGHKPTLWRRAGSVVSARIDQAAHWCSLMERGVL